MAIHSQLSISHVRVYRLGGDAPIHLALFNRNHVRANLHILPFVVSIDCQFSALFSNSQLLTGEKRNALLSTCILSATCARLGVNLTVQTPDLT